jgi:ribonuclease HII
MPWIIGIDEAGYGPNLGPLVMTAVSCWVPEKRADVDLWDLLASAVRRPTDPADERFLIADSKQVYSSTRGLRDLEAGVGPLLSLAEKPRLPDLIGRLCPGSTTELCGERWYTGTSVLPLEANGEEVAAATARLGQTCQSNQVFWGPVRSVVVCPARFNQIVARFGSKGAVLGQGLTELLRASLADGDGEPVRFFIDKHGGRNTYAAMLQDAVPGGLVIAREESMARSTYQIAGHPREVRLTFQPRADTEHFCVAWASMVSKYLREVLMREFNHYWQTHVPGLKPTAGYPGDAARYFRAIWPAAERLGLTRTSIWRER